MKIAIASCSRIKRVTNPNQTAWKRIQDEDPDLLLLLGDNIYLDENHNPDRAALATDLRAQYKAQFEEENFKALIDQMGPMPKKGQESRIFAIYDDHDFIGDNRYGADTALEKDLRFKAREVFVERFGRRDTFPNRMCSVTRNVGGLVDIFILDGRFYRQPPTPAEKDDEFGMLGAAQWDWLSKALDTPPDPARYTIIMSGTTFHDFGDDHDSWSRQYTAAAEKLAGKLKDRPGTFVVSGDVHFNTWSDENGVVEIVSSAVATKLRKPDGSWVERGNFGILTLDEDKMDVSLRTIKTKKEFTVKHSNWVLPSSGPGR